ncbi:ABC transporter permease subunit [Marinovum sp. 2_MG-2023]|uniref:ABC transporter permease n=1 Tax=unclassified Marinovum TaxID=2647166 RepID=UPI0026E4876D|nr:MULTISPECIES: ABC transporter permease subunit [unclassified Marinovum]MDO6729596.1 ABC transporter permease subunit [Marinovum sp. 2_MG-2023]MDO6780250.1 ABC transporter permease subunit [Marinovum sp. 1_MG-2023]
MPDYTLQLLIGAGVTLLLGVFSAVVALSLATVFLLLSQLKNRGINGFIRVYSTVVRGIPEILVIFLTFFGAAVILTKLFGRYTELSPFFAGVLALGLVFAAYSYEVLRGAFEAIPKGQFEAGHSLGLRGTQSFLHIIFPQLMQRALPGLGNLWLILLKETSLVSVIGLEELMRKSSLAAGVKHDPLFYYCYGALFYLAITAFSEIALKGVSTRVNRHMVPVNSEKV